MATARHRLQASSIEDAAKASCSVIRVTMAINVDFVLSDRDIRTKLSNQYVLVTNRDSWRLPLLILNQRRNQACFPEHRRGTNQC